MALTFNPKIFQDIEEKCSAWKKKLNRVFCRQTGTAGPIFHGFRLGNQ